MRKMITLLAAAALTVSPFAFAEDTTGNPNDVLQTVGQPGNTTNQNTGGPTVADAATSSTSDSSASMSSSDNKSASTSSTSTTKHKHKKCSKCKSKHKHKKHTKKSTTPATDNSSMSAPSSGSTSQ